MHYVDPKLPDFWPLKGLDFGVGQGMGRVWVGEGCACIWS